MSASTTYSLKKIVLARALAELTVLGILVLLPFGLIALGKFFALHIILRVSLCLLSPIALYLLWGMCQITFMIVISESGMTGRSLLKKEEFAWQDILSIKQCSTMGWREFKITHNAGEFSFPCVFDKLPALIDAIRSHLPNRGRATNGGAQVYKLSILVFIFELGKTVLQFGFSMLIFWFYDSLRRSGTSSKEDLLLIIGLAIIVALAVTWKFIQTLLMVHEVQLSNEGLKLRSFFKTMTISWTEISKIASTGLFYPEGLFVSANKKNYLVASTIDSFDELSEELQEHLKKP